MTEQLGLPGVGIAKLIPHANAYAARPGTGPDGESCRTCRNLDCNVRSRRHYKCGLVNWTNGRATDINIHTPACERWEAN